MVLTKTYKNGTVLIIHKDGTASINGYILPPGYKNAELLAQGVDEGWAPAAERGDGPAPTAAIPALVERACNPEICTLQLYETARDTHQKILQSMPSGPVWQLAAVCAGGGAAAYAGAGGTVCIAVATDGLGVYATAGSALGPQAGYFGGAGIAVSNGGLEDQRGAFGFYEVGGDVVVGFDAAYASASGIYNEQVLFTFGGKGGGAGEGTSNTWVWHPIKW